MRHIAVSILTILAVLVTPLSAAEADGPFRDVSGTLADEIVKAYNAGLISGYEDGTFRPNENVTRAAFAKMVVLAVETATKKTLPAGSEPFPDVQPGQTLYQYVVRAYKAGYISGYKDGTFGYNKPISRQEAAAILQRALNLPLQPENFRDVPDNSTLAKHIGAVAAAGIMQGYGDTFRPTQNLPRGQAAAVAYRAYEKLGGKAPVGTRENPAPLGTEVKVGDNWRVAVVDIVEDAWPIIREENMFNEPPAEGHQFVMARLRFTYVGKESGTPWLHLMTGYLGANRVLYWRGGDTSCGVIPDSIYDVDELFPGASVEANVCWSIPSGAVKGGLIAVEEFLSSSDARVFFEGVK